MTEQNEQTQETQGRPSPLIPLVMVVMMFLGFFLAESWLRSKTYDHIFASEFGYERGTEGHPLLIASRLQALCDDYEDAERRLAEATQEVQPGNVPGTEGERIQFLRDAKEKLAQENAKYAREHFNFSRQLAESEGPLPAIDGCTELVPTQ